MSDFLEDARTLLQQTSNKISEDVTDEEVIEAILLFALGIERVLKEILHRVNPLYVYKKMDFKYTVYQLYKESLLPSSNLLKKPPASSNDMIAFGLALSSVLNISKTAQLDSGKLIYLKKMRDIIAHRPLKELNLKEAKKFLLEHFIKIIHDFAKELDVNINTLVTDSTRLVIISTKCQKSVSSSVELKLSTHKQTWDKSEPTPKIIQKIEKENHEAMTISKTSDVDVIEIPCPACNNRALLFIEPDFDVEGSNSWVVGIFVSQLLCNYCGLKINDFEEIDYLELDRGLYPDPDENEYT